MSAVRQQLSVLNDRKDSGPEHLPGKPGPQRAGRFDKIAKTIWAEIGRQAWWVIFGFGVGLAALVGWVDYLVGSGLSFTPFYLGPVALVTWLLGRRGGIAISIAATMYWLPAFALRSPRPHWDTLVPYWNIAVQLGIFLVMSLILSGLRSALDHEKDLARTDPVTGAPNARAFFEHIEYELERSVRYRHPFTVAYLDIDNFKSINDSFGHSTGDTLLQTVASTARENLRSSDLAARIAGDEFTLLLPETGRKESALVLMRVRKALTEAMVRNGWPVTFSIGVVTYTNPPPTVDALIQIADDLMYNVKRSGKNSIRHSVYGEKKDAA